MTENAAPEGGPSCCSFSWSMTHSDSCYAAGREDALASREVPTWLRAAALQIMLDHRRVRNVRACSADGCSWKPVRPGYASDPEATRRRHEQFNEHVVDLILGLL